MIKELYIDGYLVDIDDNFDIVRQYSSPFFSDVTQLKNNASYSTKIPDTENNRFVMDYLFREDSDTTFPYRVHKANYYVNSFPVFENAEVRVIDDFELQFVWGLNRGKYLPLFEKKLNEILPNETTILSSDWIVEWKKANVIYATGKKYKYLNYVSGERESEVKIIGTTEQPLTQAPEPFLSNLKEMTMHPFVLFNDILDLIIRYDVSFVEKTMTNNPVQDTFTLNSVTGLYVGMIVYVIVDFGNNLYADGVKITEINGLNVTFNVDVSSYYELNEKIYFADTNIKPFEFDDLKAKLTNKGLILGGDKGYKLIEYLMEYDVDTDLEFISIGGENWLYIPLDSFLSSFGVNSTFNIFQVNQFVTGNKKDNLNISLNITTHAQQIDILKYNYDSQELKNIQTFYGVPDDIGSPLWYSYNVEFSFLSEIGNGYLLRCIRTDGLLNLKIKSGSVIEINQEVNYAMYSMITSPTVEPSHYNCLMNLPEITAADFINEMLKMTGLFIGHDTDGNMKFLSLDKFKTNLLAGSIYDWSGKVSQKEKSYFQFNSNAQKNWIKFNNSDDRTYTAKDYISVDDTTLDSEKDLYTVSFALPEKASSGIVEFILYKQKVTSSEKDVSGTPTEVKSFSQDYSEKPSVCVYDSSGTAIIENVLPNGTNGFVTPYYEVFKDIIYRPRVVDIVVKLDFLDTLEIDFEKPVYIAEYGKYAVLLDIKIPDDGLCNAKILLINQTL